jgi:hypothetical protein
VQLVRGDWCGDGITVPNLFLNLLVIIYTLRYLQIPLKTYLVESWLRPVIAMLVLPMMWLLPGWPIRDWFMLGIALATGLVPYAMIVLILEDKVPHWGRTKTIRAGSVSDRALVLEHEAQASV